MVWMRVGDSRWADGRRLKERNGSLSDEYF